MYAIMHFITRPYNEYFVKYGNMKYHDYILIFVNLVKLTPPHYNLLQKQSNLRPIHAMCFIFYIENSVIGGNPSTCLIFSRSKF